MVVVLLLLDHRSVRIDGQYLRFISITPADAGVYYCSASNHFGNATEKAEVVVNRGYTYDDHPQNTRYYDLPVGKNINLVCNVKPNHGPQRGEIRVSKSKRCSFFNYLY